MEPRSGDGSSPNQEAFSISPSTLPVTDPNFLLLHPIIVYHRQLATEFYEHVLKQINYPPAPTPLPSIDEEKEEGAFFSAPVLKLIRVFISDELKIDSTGFLTLRCVENVSVKTVKETVVTKLRAKQGNAIETMTGVMLGVSASSCVLSLMAKDKGDRLDKNKTARKGAALEEKSLIASHFPPDAQIYEVILTSLAKRDRRASLPRVLQRIGTKHHTFRFDATIKGIRLAVPPQSLLSVQWTRGPRAVQSMFVPAETLPEVSQGVMGWPLAPLSINATLYNAGERGYCSKPSKLLVKRRANDNNPDVAELGFVELDLALCATAADQEKVTEMSLPFQNCQEKNAVMVLSIHTVPASAEDANPVDEEGSPQSAGTDQGDEHKGEHKDEQAGERKMPPALLEDIGKTRSQRKTGGLSSLKRWRNTKPCSFQFELVVQKVKLNFPADALLSVQWTRGSHHQAQSVYVPIASLPEPAAGVRQLPDSMMLQLPGTLYQEKERKEYQEKFSRIIFKCKSKHAGGNDLVVSEIGGCDLDLARCALVDQEGPRSTEHTLKLEGPDPNGEATLVVKAVLQTSPDK